MKDTKYPAGTYRLYVETGYAGATHEEIVQIPEDLGLENEDWDELDDNEKESMLDEAAEQYRDEQIEYGFEQQ